MSQQLRYRLSHAVETTSRPPIPQAYAWAERYKPTPGRPLLDMSQGVPGTPPPKIFLDTLSQTSANPQYCGYVPNAGEPALRKAVVEEMKVAYGEHVDLRMEDVAITAGCNMAFAASIMTVAESGDEVILPVPWYFNHEMTLTSLGIKPITLQTFPEDGFLPSPEKCEHLITSKTKAIVLVTPNNPTGAIYPPSLLASFATLARSRNIALILDETYRDFLPAGSAPHYLFNPSKPSTSSTTSRAHDLPSDWVWRETLIHLFSFSKSYCIPGHRVGLICASPALMPLLNIALDNIQICAPRPPQMALAGMLDTLRPFVRSTAEAVRRRHEIFAQSIQDRSNSSGWRWEIGAQGGYYAFVKHPFKDVSARDVCERLAVEMGVVTLPAGFFGPEHHGEDEADEMKGVDKRWIRFSVANIDDEKVRLVCDRLGECVEKFGWAVESRTK